MIVIYIQILCIAKLAISYKLLQYKCINNAYKLSIHYIIWSKTGLCVYCMCVEWNGIYRFKSHLISFRFFFCISAIFSSTKRRLWWNSNQSCTYNFLPLSKKAREEGITTSFIKSHSVTFPPFSSFIFSPTCHYSIVQQQKYYLLYTYDIFLRFVILFEKCRDVCIAPKRL